MERPAKESQNHANKLTDIIIEKNMKNNIKNQKNYSKIKRYYKKLEGQNKSYENQYFKKKNKRNLNIKVKNT